MSDNEASAVEWYAEDAATVIAEVAQVDRAKAEVLLERCGWCRGERYVHQHAVFDALVAGGVASDVASLALATPRTVPVPTVSTIDRMR